MVAGFTFGLRNTKSASATRRSQFILFWIDSDFSELLLLGGNKKIRGDAFWETGETRSTQLVSKLPRVEICFQSSQDPRIDEKGWKLWF